MLDHANWTQDIPIGDDDVQERESR